MAPEKYNNYENGDFSVQYAFASKFFYVVKLYSDLGFDLIVPYMFFKNSDTLEEFRKLLNDYPVLIVNIVCPVEELQRREIKRENRKIGSAEEQLHLLETDFENSEIVDNFINSNETCADKIIDLFWKVK